MGQDDHLLISKTGQRLACTGRGERKGKVGVQVGGESGEKKKGER